MTVSEYVVISSSVTGAQDKKAPVQHKPHSTHSRELSDRTDSGV
jgi:hypothetical protein